MNLRIFGFVFFFALHAVAGEAAFFSPDCRDCETAAHSGGARVGNDVGVQVTPAVPVSQASPAPVSPAPLAPSAPVRQ